MAASTPFFKMYSCSFLVIHGWRSGVERFIINQGTTHRIPNTAMAANVVCHPYFKYSTAMNGAATTDPNDAPAPNMPWAIALSFGGNHSAFDLVAPGQLPASKKPRQKRKTLNDDSVFANACRAIEMLHPRMDTTNPSLVPMASINFPIKL